MDQPTVFISHIVGESVLVRPRQTHRQRDFPGRLDVCVSSDGESISAGANWRSTIERRVSTVGWALLLVGILIPLRVSAADCTGLAALPLAHASVTSAQTVQPGTFTVPENAPRPDASFFTAFERLATFCRVQVVSSPARGSQIELEVWLPESHWNGKYVGAGNGGYGGSLNYYRLAEAVNAGYAGSSTDTGHRGPLPDNEAAWTDFDHRAIHDTAEQAKAIVRAFYGQPPRRSYFYSCSNGGRQALTEAERYPADYDGIIAGAPSLTFGVNRDADVSNPRLEAFKARGGKLMLYHGENDQPAPSVQYYQRLVARLGQKAADDFVRLYVIPEMGHCGGGPVPEFGIRLWPVAAAAARSMIVAVEQWVDHGIAPGAIIGTKYRIDDDVSSGIERTRPLCPYPQRAVWTGDDSANEATNYVCRTPP